MFITYQGTQTALTLDVQGKAIRLVPSQPTKVSANQLEILKKRPLTKIMIDKGVIKIDMPKEGNKSKTKAVSDMTVKELEAYIKANGGEFDSDDNKPELLKIAQGIESKM